MIKENTEMNNHCVNITCDKCGIKYCPRCEDHNCTNDKSVNRILGLPDAIKKYGIYYALLMLEEAIEEEAYEKAGYITKEIEKYGKDLKWYVKSDPLQKRIKMAFHYYIYQKRIGITECYDTANKFLFETYLAHKLNL